MRILRNKIGDCFVCNKIESLDSLLLWEIFQSCLMTQHYCIQKNTFLGGFMFMALKVVSIIINNILHLYVVLFLFLIIYIGTL